MDFVDNPTGVSGPNFSMDPLMTEQESKADMERAKQEFEQSEQPTARKSAMNFVNPHSQEMEPVDPVGDGMGGMGFDEFLMGESDEQEELPPLF